MSDKPIIHTPHDLFFKNSVNDVSVAKDFFKAHLPPSLQQRIQWNTLQLTNKSFSDDQLRELHSDVVYACQLDHKKAYLYLLIEQQTNPDLLLPFRFLQYNVRLLEQHLKQQEEKKRKGSLPMVINLCPYAGKQSPYPYSVDIYDCFEDPILARAELFKPLPMIDLGQLSEEELKQHGTASGMELLLKQARHRTMLKWIQSHAEEVRDILAMYYGKSSIHYILAVENKYSPKEVVDALIAIEPHKAQEIMTAARQLELKGEKRGMQQGMQQGILLTARNMLMKLHMNIKDVQAATGLSIEELMKLQEESKG